MASPQLEHGYVRIANELFERIIQADLGRNEVRLMLLLVRLSYGMQQRSAALTGSLISEHLGINEGNARKCLVSLMSMRLVFCDHKPSGPKPGVYRVNKNWEQWSACPGVWPEPIKRQYLSSLSISQRSTSDAGALPQRSTSASPEID